MTRLIDADELKELFAETITYIARKTNKVGALEHMIRSSATVIQMIDDAPTVDAVAVIRCRNCRHRLKNKTCLRTMKRKPDDGYCDEGEKDEGSVLAKYMAV